VEAKWQSGKVAKWRQSGKVAKWQSGKVAKWTCIGELIIVIEFAVERSKTPQAECRGGSRRAARSRGSFGKVVCDDPVSHYSSSIDHPPIDHPPIDHPPIDHPPIDHLP
jgi:hypothetical protein